MRHLGRHIIRRDWDEWEPTLISECAFATANIFSSLKMIHIFTVNPHLGPLRISLGYHLSLHFFSSSISLLMRFITSIKFKKFMFLKYFIGRMVLDIVKFLLIYFLVLFSFACGLNQLLWYYAAIREQVGICLIEQTDKIYHITILSIQ